MITQFYSYSSHNNQKLYFFQSIGVKGTIIKVVKFSQISPGRYNLGLADFEKGRLVEDVISNNFDVLKVFATVAAIIKHFTQQNPQRFIVILAIEERRSRVYNAIFSRKALEITEEFFIWGINFDDSEEFFIPETAYKGFIVKRKNLES